MRQVDNARRGKKVHLFVLFRNSVLFTPVLKEVGIHFGAPDQFLHMKRIPVDLEYIFKASPAILYKFLTTPACLVRWFCDGVDINNEIYTFSWDGSEENAEVIDDIEEERIRFRWDGAPRYEYLEFRMYLSPVTEETVLEITDFANEKEVDDLKRLWDSQIKNLRQETGG